MAVQIQLEINGEYKTFTAQPKKALIVREGAELFNKISEIVIPSIEDLDAIANYIVKAFDNQFTVDDVYNGLDSDLFIPTQVRLMSSLFGVLNEKIGQFPNGEKTE